MRLINVRTPYHGGLATIQWEKGKIVSLTPQSLSLIDPQAVALKGASRASLDSRPQTIDASGEWIVPAGLDIHIHAREPGLTHKEDWMTVGASARSGGVAAVVDMPNTIPPTLFAAQVEEKAAVAAKSGIDFKILLGVSAKNIAELPSILSRTELPLCGVKVFYGPSTGDLVFSDLEALGRAIPKKGHRLIVFHSEDQCGIDCNKEHLKSEYGAAVASTDPLSYAIHSRLRSSETAWTSTQTIMDWATSWDGPVHLAHVSTPREIDMVLEAKRKGGQVTSEVAPHHLLLSTEDYGRLGGYLKVNPPVRSLEEVKQLRRHLSQGHIDMIATDHAPHTTAEKVLPYDKCPSGMPSLDFYYPLALEIARICDISPEKLTHLVSRNPAQLFGFDNLGSLAPGKDATFVWLDRTPWTISRKEVVSKCGWTPYDGLVLPGKVRAVWQRGQCVLLR